MESGTRALIIAAGMMTLWGVTPSGAQSVEEFYRRNPEQWPVFNEAMRSVTAPMTPTITAAYDWSRFPVIADIAGGIGTQLVDTTPAVWRGSATASTCASVSSGACSRYAG